MKRSIIFLLLAVMLAVGFVSCDKKDNTPTTDTTDSTSATAEKLTLLEGGVSRYEIIYPDVSRQEDADAVVRFQNEFYKATSFKLEKNSDFLNGDNDYTSMTCKILIGKTAFPESEQAYRGLMYQEYNVEVIGTNIAIAAYTNSGYDAAIKWFNDNVLSCVENGTLELEAFSHRESLVTGYPISKHTIGGNDLMDYTLVYSDDGILNELTELRDNIASKTGCFMDIVRDSESSEKELEILFGETNRDASAQVEVPEALHYTLKVVDGKLVVKFGGEHSKYKVLENFIDIISGESDEINIPKSFSLTSNFFDDPCDSSKPDNTDIRILCANTEANIKGYNGDIPEGFSFERRLEIFFAALDFYEPTVVGVQEFCTSWSNGFENYKHSDLWSVLEFKNPNISSENVLSTIMYRKDIFDLVDSGMQYYSAYNNGRCRCITWAVLRVKSTGKEFCFISTHWDGGTSQNTETQVSEISEFVNQKAEKYPVFTTGDFNSNEWTEAFKKYLANINSVDAMYAAEKRLNVFGSWHSWGNDESSAGSCDHITATKDTTVLQFETLKYNEQIYASDHSWLIADIKFN